MAGPSEEAEPRTSEGPLARSPFPGGSDYPEARTRGMDVQRDPVNWNTWFRPLRVSEEPTAVLTVGETYRFTVDLASVAYGDRATRTVPGDPRLVQELNSISADSIGIYIRPVLAGRGLEFLPNEERMREFRVTMGRLRQPAIRVAQEGLAAFAQRVHAGRITVDVRAKESGCAAIALSIWNRELDRPLDHVVHRVAVTQTGVAPPSCPSGPTGGKGLKENLLTLLDEVPDQKADAALHIFEMRVGETIYSNAVFLARSATGTEVYSWPLTEILSTYVFSSGNLLAALDEARSNRNYLPLAEKLTNLVFTTRDQDQSQADAARRALEKLPAQPRPVFFARLVDVQGRSLFLPLGLLKSRDRLLSESMTLLQPLPRESYTQKSDRCIGKWTIVLPRNLGDAALESYLSPAQAIRDRVTDMTKFSSYIESRASPPTAPEGLLLLAHQAHGQVWFEDQGNYLHFSSVRREYQPGSVAVIAACSVGNLSADDRRMSFLTRLNDRGIDGAIVAPFEVPKLLGIGFALHFASEVQKAFGELQEHPQQVAPDLGELFDRAFDSLLLDPQYANKISPHMKNEFLILGNSRLRLCQKSAP
jgi:hypothetical protein